MAAVLLFLGVPVSFPDADVVAPLAGPGAESNFGGGLYEMSGSVLATGQVAFGPTFGVVMTPDSQSETLMTTGPMTAGTNDVVAGLDTNGADPVLKAWRWDSVGLNEVASLPIPASESLVTAGDRIVVGGEGEIRIYALEPEEPAGLVLEDTIETDLTRLRMDMNDAGTFLALSGVPRLAGAGDLKFFVGSANGWKETERFTRIGGGPVLVTDRQVIVQRNSFFTEPSGPWTVLESSARIGSGADFEVIGELPGVGSSVATDDTLIYLGDPDTEIVLKFQRSALARWPFRFLQAIRSPGGADLERFGTSLTVSEGQLVVGSPGAMVDGIDEEGRVRWFDTEDGPVGCTLVGTKGDDILEGTARNDVICGLSGDDILIGGQGRDIGEGGEGVDTCEEIEVPNDCS